MINTNNNYSSSVQDLNSNLTLDKLRQLIESFKDIKILIGITCKPEFYDYLVKLPELITETGSNRIFGPRLYIISNQEENIKYWYNNQEKELREYLKNNI